MSYSGNRPGVSTPMNPIVKGRSRPSSGVGMSLLDVIGNDVKSYSAKDSKSSQSAKLNPVDIIKALNPSFRPPSAPIVPLGLSLGTTADAPSKRSKSASALPALPRKSRPSSRTSFHSGASVFMDDDATVEGLSIYGYNGTASATPRSELSSHSRIMSAVSRSTSSLANPHFTPFHTSREFAHAFAEVELDDMIDDASIDSFLLDFKRKSRMPFAASKIQSWWRMARQCRAFWRYRMGKAKRRSKFKQRVFNGWHGLSAAQGRCRNLYLNISFRYWIKYVMDSKGWVNFCSEACNILSQRPSGLPARVLWNICIDPSTWISAQDEDRAMGDPLPIRGLVVALQSLRVYCSKCISRTFRRWIKAFKWGAEQRAKGRLKLGHLLRARFREKFHLKFQMWSRWAFFTRARRLHTPLPVFTEYIPFWALWVEKKKRKLMYAVPLEKSFWFRWMFFKLKKVCQEKVSKSSRLSLVDQVFCVSRMKNALNAWTKGVIVIRSELAFLHGRWKIFCLAIRIRKTRHKMKRELLKANDVAVSKRAFVKWANDVKNALSCVVAANNRLQMSGAIPTLSRSFYIWTEQRAHSILVSVFMKWSQRARQRLTWTVFLRMHAAWSRRKLMRSVFEAWRLPAQAMFLPITDAEVVAMYILSHRHDSQRTNVTYGNRAFEAMSQQIADARNYTLVRASEAMQSCPFQSGDKLCIQLTSALWLQQVKAIISVKPSDVIGHIQSSIVPYRNLNDVLSACRSLLDPSFVDGVLKQPRQTFSKAMDVSQCNWGECTSSAAISIKDRHEYRPDSAALLWTDLVYLTAVVSSSCAHENSLRQHSTKAEMVAAVQEATDKTGSKPRHREDNFVSRSLQLIGMRTWLSSAVGGWNSMSSLVPLVRNIDAVWELRLKERRALVLRDNLIIISGKVKDESSIFAALFKLKKLKKKKAARKGSKKKSRKLLSKSKKTGDGSSTSEHSTNSASVISGSESGGGSTETSVSSSPISKLKGFPEVQLGDSIIKLPEGNLSMIQRLTNMVHCGGTDDPISSFALSETASQAMEPDSEMFDQQLHNRYVAIANDFHVQNAADAIESEDSDESPLQLNGVDSDDEQPSERTNPRPALHQAARTDIHDDVSATDESAPNAAAPVAVTLDASSSLGPDFHISLAMKSFIAPKPIRIPRTALPVSLLAIARNLADQLHEKYETVKLDLPSQILQKVARKMGDPEVYDSSEDADDAEENAGQLCSSPNPNTSVADPNLGLHFISESTNEMVVNADLGGVQVISQGRTASNIVFDMEGDFDVDDDGWEHLNHSAPTAPETAVSFSALEAKFVLPFSSPVKGKPFQHWDAHDKNILSNSNEDIPVLLAVPKVKISNQQKNRSPKKGSVVFSPPGIHTESASISVPTTMSSMAVPQVAPAADFSLPDVPDIVQLRLTHSNSTGAFPSATTPSKQNRHKAVPDRLEELISNVNPSLSKQPQPSKSESSADPAAETAGSMSSGAITDDENRELRRNWSEVGHKNALKRKQASVLSANAAKALSQAEDGANRRKQLLHEATESAYDALELMAPHLKAIFEENFDALINWFINANTRNAASADHHHWHELMVQRDAESRVALTGGLVADSDQHIKRVFQSRQHYRAMMAKAEFSGGRTGGLSPRGKECLYKSKPSVEQDRQQHSSTDAPKSILATFTSGEREFITGLTKPIAPVVAGAPASSDLLSSGKNNLDNFGKLFAGSLNTRPVGKGTTLPFSKVTPTVNATPRDDALVQAPEFVVVDSRKLIDPPAPLHIAGSEISGPFDSAEKMFRSFSGRRSDIVISKTAPFNTGFFKTNPATAAKPTVQAAGLPIVGGIGLAVTTVKKQPLPRLESSLPLNVTVLEKAAIDNVQGLIQTKSILKAARAPLQPAAERVTTQTPTSIPLNRTASKKDSPALAGVVGKVLCDAESQAPAVDVALAPRALSSTNLLGLKHLEHLLISDADAEVEQMISATPGNMLPESLSPIVSPLPSSSPVVVNSYSTAQAVADFNQFLASFSIQDVNKSQDLNLTLNQLELELLKIGNRIPLAAANVSETPINDAEKVAVPEIAPVPDRQSVELKPVSSSSVRAAKSQISRHDTPVEAAQVPKAASVSRISAVIPRASSDSAVAAPAASMPLPSVANETASPAATAATENVPAAPCPEIVDASGMPDTSITSETQIITEIGAEFPRLDVAGAEAMEMQTMGFEVTAQPVFASHASTAPCDDISSLLDVASTTPAASLSALASVSSDSTPLTSIISSVSVPQVPPSTPQASQVAHDAQPLTPVPAKSTQKPGVQGSAIRSFLLNMQEKSAAVGHLDPLSPAEIIQQQRASAVELIRQRNALDKKLRQNPHDDIAVGTSASQISSSKNRRAALDSTRVDDDESDDELAAGHIFKNHKIKLLQNNMSQLSRGFNALRSMYPPAQEIGESGDIAAGVHHFHHASSRITDRSADNSAITNRLSAFISDLGRRSPARGAVFSFDAPDEQSVAPNSAADIASKDARNVTGARAARAANTAAEDKVAAGFEAASAASQLVADENGANLKHDEFLSAVASSQGIEASVAVKKSPANPDEGQGVTLKVIKARKP